MELVQLVKDVPQTSHMGYSVSEVAHALEVRRVSASQCVTRGEKILLCRETSFVDMIRRHFLDDADSLRNKR